MFAGILVGILANFVYAILASIVNNVVVPRLQLKNPRWPVVVPFVAVLIWGAINAAWLLIAAGAPEPTEPWVALGIGAAVASLLYVLWLGFSPMLRVGVVGADRSVREGIDYKAALGLVRESLDFLGTGAAKLSGQDTFSATLLRCRNDREIRFLLRRPTDAKLVEAAKRSGRDPHRYQETVRRSLRTMRDIREDRQLQNLRVRFYDEEPVFRLMFIDESMVLVSYNHYGQGDGSQLPQLHVVRSSFTPMTESFYYPFLKYFNLLWDQADEWDFAQYLQGTTRPGNAKP